MNTVLRCIYVWVALASYCSSARAQAPADPRPLLQSLEAVAQREARVAHEIVELRSQTQALREADEREHPTRAPKVMTITGFGLGVGAGLSLAGPAFLTAVLGDGPGGDSDPLFTPAQLGAAGAVGAIGLLTGLTSLSLWRRRAAAREHDDEIARLRGRTRELELERRRLQRERRRLWDLAPSVDLQRRSAVLNVRVAL